MEVGELAEKKSICTFPNCSNARHANELCTGHDKQRALGRELTPLRRRFSPSTPIDQRLHSQTRKTKGCWLFTGTLRRGYGSICFDRRVIPAHRLAWELENGPTPAGLEIDHMCRNKACVNPAHLQAVSKKQNGENRGPNANSRLGVRGVYFNRKDGRYHVQVCHHRRRHSGGTYPSVHEAEAAAIRLRNSLYTNNLADRAE